jgi:murein endopeptidase
MLLAPLAQGLTGCSPKGSAVFDAPAPEAAKDAPQQKEQEPLRAPSSKKRGDQAVYTIVYGGSLRNVANLYKLYPEEIAALNPGVNEDLPLPVTSEVVVYRDTAADSESIGLPHAGSIAGAMPLLDGPGRKITAERWKTWATRSTVLQLDRVLTAWSKRERNAPQVLVSNLSARQGGPLAPHKTHQSGRDVDLGYITRQDGEGPPTWQHVSAENLDAERTWQLLKLLVQEADVEVIFIDRNLQRLLLKHALKQGTVPKQKLAHWLEVATGERNGGPLVKHVPGHADHLHVRFRCPADERRCRS